jgi:hypothetical protein
MYRGGPITPQGQPLKQAPQNLYALLSSWFALFDWFLFFYFILVCFYFLFIYFFFFFFECEIELLFLLRYSSIISVVFSAHVLGRIRMCSQDSLRIAPRLIPILTWYLKASTHHNNNRDRVGLAVCDLLLNWLYSCILFLFSISTVLLLCWYYFCWSYWFLVVGFACFQYFDWLI